MAQVIAISNQKGGVAKTTTCLSLGACLADLGHKTLVVDLDPQADLTLAVGLDGEALAWTMADLLDPKHNGAFTNTTAAALPFDLPHTTEVEGLDLLPADPRLSAIERFLYDLDDYEIRLGQVLSLWQERYAYILVDCPPSLSAFTLMALTAAQSVLIPVQAEYYAARRLERLLAVVKAVQERTNAGLICYMLATMYDQRNRICRGILQQLRNTFPGHLLETVIGVDTRLRECPAVGEPITRYAPRTRACRQHRRLARELHRKIKQGKEKV